MKKLLLVCGNTRIGDTVHVGANLNQYKRSHEITWVHGDYERGVVEFLRAHTDLGIVKTIMHRFPDPRGIPQDGSSIRLFIDSAKKNYDHLEYDKVVTQDEDLLQEASSYPILSVHDLPPAEHLPREYVAIHSATISKWKIVPALFEIQAELPLVAVGGSGEPIHAGAIDCRGLSFSDSARVVYNAKCVVGCHSSIVCLAYHLNVPVITCHYSTWRGFRFGSHRANCVDLVCANRRDIEEAVRMLSSLPRQQKRKDVI